MIVKEEITMRQRSAVAVSLTLLAGIFLLPAAQNSSRGFAFDYLPNIGTIGSIQTTLYRRSFGSKVTRRGGGMTFIVRGAGATWNLQSPIFFQQ